MADVKAFMKLIKAMESSGGKDTKHTRMTAGMHEGDTAIGNYGVMPNTAKEIAKRKIGTDEQLPSDDVIKNIPNPQVETLLAENPQLAERYAEFMAKRVLDKTKGDPIAGMTAWHYGHNLSPQALKEKMQEAPEYVEKVVQRIDENALSSKLPSLMDLMKVYPPDYPRSKKRD